MTEARGTLLLTRSEIARLMTLEDYVGVVEQAFRAHAEGRSLSPGLLHIDAPDGEFHIKAGGLAAERAYAGVKVNGGFFQNAARFGLPNIQGVIVLSDASNGSPLAVMDSIEVTIQRTGAATAVAARRLARSDAATALICGCGRQGRIQLRALAHVLPLQQAMGFDRDAAAADGFAEEMQGELGFDVRSVTDLGSAAPEADVIVTCTPAREAFLNADAVRPGAFVAAVGADSPDKQELDPRLMTRGKVVVDLLDQCALVGELHHAIAAGLTDRSRVHAELGEIVSGQKPGRESPEEVIVFDSTGTALQDVAAAAAAYERAVAAGAGRRVDLAG
jgi:alanine dehydrogenase